MTARDLVRQVTADWQERIKHGSQLSFAEFVDTVLDPDKARRARAKGATATVLGDAGRRRRAAEVGLDAAARAGAPGHRATPGFTS